MFGCKETSEECRRGPVVPERSLRHVCGSPFRLEASECVWLCVSIGSEVGGSDGANRKQHLLSDV